MNMQTQPHPIQIPVYDTFTIDFSKYPRIGTPKENTDRIIIQFLMNQEYLEKVSKSYMNAVTFYNECKEYYFVFKSFDGNSYKKFSAQEIIFLVNQTNIHFNQNRNPIQQQRYLRKYTPLEQYYYILIRNKDFYLNLFITVQDAKLAFFQRREINFKLNPPFDFYGDIPQHKLSAQVYTCQELLELNAYVQFLLKNKIYKELPEPLFLRNYFEPSQTPQLQLSNQQQNIINIFNGVDTENMENEIVVDENENEESEENIKTIIFTNLDN